MSVYKKAAKELLKDNDEEWYCCLAIKRFSKSRKVKSKFRYHNNPMNDFPNHVVEVERFARIFKPVEIAINEPWFGHYSDPTSAHVRSLALLFMHEMEKSNAKRKRKLARGSKKRSS